MSAPPGPVGGPPGPMGGPLGPGPMGGPPGPMGGPHPGPPTHSVQRSDDPNNRTWNSLYSDDSETLTLDNNMPDKGAVSAAGPSPAPPRLPSAGPSQPLAPAPVVGLGGTGQGMPGVSPAHGSDFSLGSVSAATDDFAGAWGGQGGGGADRFGGGAGRGGGGGMAGRGPAAGRGDSRG